MTKDWSEREKGLMGEISGLHDRIDTRDEATVGNAKTEALKRLGGDDEDLTKKLSGEFERLGGDKALTADEVNRIYDEANALVKHKTEKVNPINQYQPGSSGPGIAPTKKKDNYADSDDGKKLAASMGLDLTDPNKKVEEKKD